MLLKELHLKQFRNYEDLSLSFQDGLTIITGENAQGKTNLLEAIFLLSLAKSHRTNQDREMISWETDQAIISGLIQTKNYEFPLEMHLTQAGKIGKVNYLEQEKLSQFIGKLNVILFAPEDLQIIKGSPGGRRKFIDAELGQAQPLYLQTLLDYNRTLKQRNRYLKEFGYRSTFDELYFAVLTEQLIDQATILIQERKRFVKALEELAQPIHTELSKGRDILELSYKANHSTLNGIDESELKDAYQDLFNRAKEREKERGVTLYGPHRDDLEFLINENNAQFYASQGQQRTIVLALKLAETELLKQLTGEYPVLLLDDVLSELDDGRQHILMSHIEAKVQTFLTTASIQGIELDALNKAQILKVRNGEIYSE